MKHLADLLRAAAPSLAEPLGREWPDVSVRGGGRWLRRQQGLCAGNRDPRKWEGESAGAREMHDGQLGQDVVACGVRDVKSGAEADVGVGRQLTSPRRRCDPGTA
jgi:hypothetical protein